MLLRILQSLHRLLKTEGINKTIADSVFYNAMVLNPGIEVYFLDTTGKIMYYQSPDSTIKLWTIPLANIQKHIQSKGEDYIKGPDPKNPSEQKVFSAAEVYNNGKKLGYIYVILGGNTYSNGKQYVVWKPCTELCCNSILCNYCFIGSIEPAVCKPFTAQLPKNYCCIK